MCNDLLFYLSLVKFNSSMKSHLTFPSYYYFVSSTFLSTLALINYFLHCHFWFNISSEPTEEEEKEKPYIVIIGAAIGGAFFLALVIVCGKRYCQQQQHRINRLHAMDSMPCGVLFSSSERYEVTKPKSKEDIVSYEEIGISNAATTYEELGISKESAHYEKLAFSNDAAEYEEMGISDKSAGYSQEMSTFRAPVVYDEIGASKKAEQNWTD